MEQETQNEKQHFHIGQFEGPLDLLLFLIKRSEINIVPGEKTKHSKI